MKRSISIILSFALSLCMVLSLTGCKSSDYKTAISVYESGDHMQAKELFSVLNGYSDSEEYIDKINEEIYTQALTFLDNGNTEEALGLFTQTIDYKDSSQYCAFINDPERLIREKCGAEKNNNAYTTYISMQELGFAYGVVIHDNYSSVAHYDRNSNKFACVVCTFVEYGMSGYNTAECYEGFLGHFEGCYPIIDKSIELDADSEAEVEEEFWSRYW